MWWNQGTHFTLEPAMSLHPHPLDSNPDEPARVARAAFSKGNPSLRMRDELGVFYRDEAFTALFATRGQPAESPWRVALILVMQFAEGLSDRQAADAVRSRIDWKYALSLELTDPGFDSSVLSEFRDRLIAGGAEQLLLEAMLECFKECGLLKARGRQRTDSSHVLAAVRVLNRLECVGETFRHALNSLAVAAPDWLAPQIDPAWADRYGPRFDEYRLPKGKEERQVLADQIGEDGFRLLEAVAAPDAPPDLQKLSALQTLRLVWSQQYQITDAVVRWRDNDNLPPSGQMISSPHDLDARYCVKRQLPWTGYKVHLTEVCDPDLPHLITHVETTLATVPDAQLPQIHQALAKKELLPHEHVVDAGYVDSADIVASQDEHDVRVVGPVPPDASWQARANAGFDVSCFGLDWDARRATCPEGHQSTKWSETKDRHEAPIINIRFAPKDCRTCPRRVDCTSSPTGPRHITVRPKEQHLTLQSARAYQRTAEFKARYDVRAGVEGTLSQGLRGCDLRHARYIGLCKTRLQHVVTAAALNVIRIAQWLDDPHRATTRPATFLALLPTVA
jgi:transposase